VFDSTSLEKRKLITNIKEKAISTQETSHQIVTSSNVGISVAVLGQLPSIPSLKRVIQRTRNGVQTPGTNPQNLNASILALEYTLTTNGSRFLMHESGPGNDRILIFPKTRNLDLMSQCLHWFADGTFKTSTFQSSLYNSRC
jgi:hypothetical protein